MAFRKRNIAIGTAAGRSPVQPVVVDVPQIGVRPSPLTSHPVTSTGASSLDNLLGGHAGLALGSSLLIEESGNTDFSGVLLRYFAAEGICQGHILHIVGVGEAWTRELPAVAAERSKTQSVVSSDANKEKMKIAWRYERLGQAGSERALPVRTQAQPDADSPSDAVYCHTFDLTKRLIVPAEARVNHIPIYPNYPFENILQSLQKALETSPPIVPHRLIIPALLNPALYPPNAARPDLVLRFLHSLRALLRAHSGRLTAVLTLPLELYPRSTGLVRWAEILSDGVLEFTPFPHTMDAGSDDLPRSGGGGGGSSKESEEPPQGLVRVHKLPINSERGEGGAHAGNSLGEDLAFSVSRRKFVIKPFALPPMEGDREAQAKAGTEF